MVYTYVIKCKKGNRWYTGATTDLRKRLKEHNDGKVVSTKNRGPFELIYYEGCINMNDAFTPLEIRRQRRLTVACGNLFLTGFTRERYLKTGMGKRYLKNRLRRFLSLTG